MSQFKYEIDERNLRLQLKAMEVPFSEEAWHKFESFSASCRGGGEQRVAKRFQLSFNRNVVLPVVFGSVIILFSLLLFNFVNIKNPNPAREARAESTPPAIQQAAVEVKKELPAPVETVAQPPVAEVSMPVENKIKNTLPVTAPAERIQQPVAEPEQQATPATTEASPKIRITKSQTEPSINTQAASSTEPRKKRSKKRQEVIIEPVAGEDEQVPPPAEEAAPSGEQLK
jgi:hypothetical protein